jgi:hypothetical protein
VIGMTSMPIPATVASFSAQASRVVWMMAIAHLLRDLDRGLPLTATCGVVEDAQQGGRTLII